MIERYEAMRRAEKTQPKASAGGTTDPDPDMEGVSQEDFESGCQDVLAQLAYRHREMRRPARRQGTP